MVPRDFPGSEGLIAWLNQHIEHKEIQLGESAEFLRRVIRGLMAKEEAQTIIMRKGSGRRIWPERVQTHMPGLFRVDLTPGKNSAKKEFGKKRNVSLNS